jgi:site-specific recombinase XerD
MSNQDLTLANAPILDGLTPHTRRAYAGRLSRFRAWRGHDTAPVDRSLIKRYIRSLEASGAGASVINGSLAAIKYAIRELHESGLVDSTTFAAVDSIRYRKVTGVRAGKWLSKDQVAALLGAIRHNAALSTKGRRDAALFALLLGCGLRRSEACGLNVDQIRTIDGRMMLVNVQGKGGRLRTISVPLWAQTLIEAWLDVVLK